MVKQGQNVTPAPLGEKRGMPVYRTNPSVPLELPRGRRVVEVPGGRAAMIVDNSTGELKGIGGVAFWWQEEVDRERFVKLYIEGIRNTAGLKKPGIKVFEVVYRQVQASPNTDKVELSPYIAKEHGIEERTFRRGVRELLDKEFIFQSTAGGVYFINVRYMFNGNRLAFVKAYHLKSNNAGEEAEQGQLPLGVEAPPGESSPSENASAGEGLEPS